MDMLKFASICVGIQGGGAIGVNLNLFMNIYNPFTILACSFLGGASMFFLLREVEKRREKVKP